MKTIKIITATEASKQLGFYEGESYECYNEIVINERGHWIYIMRLVNTGATIKMEEI